MLSSAIPFQFLCFSVPMHSAAEFWEEISARGVLQEKAPLGTRLLWGAGPRRLGAFRVLCHGCFSFGLVSLKGSNDIYFFLLQRGGSRTPVDQMS